MLKKVLLLILMLAASGAYPAGDVACDSLNIAMKKAHDPEARLHLLLMLSERQIDRYDKNGIHTAETAFDLADSLHLKIDKAKALNLKGIAWKIWGDNQKSMLYLYEALSIFREAGMQPEVAEVLMNIGETNRAAAFLKRSMEFLMQSLAIFEKIKDPAGLAKVYNRLAATSYELSLGGVAVANPTRLFQPLLNKRFDFEGVYKTNIAFRSRYDLTLLYTRRSNLYASKLGLAALRISTDIITGALYSGTDQIRKARTVFDTVLDHIKKTNLNSELPLVLFNIANLSYKQKDYEQALVQAKESFRIAQELDIKNYIILSSGLIGEMYMSMENYKEALSYMRTAFIARMEYYQMDIDMKVQSLQYDHEIET